MAFLSIASFRAVWMAVLSSSVQVLIVNVGDLHLIETSVDAGLFEVVQVVMVVVMVEQDCCCLLPRSRAASSSFSSTFLAVLVLLDESGPIWGDRPVSSFILSISFPKAFKFVVSCFKVLRRCSVVYEHAYWRVAALVEAFLHSLITFKQAVLALAAAFASVLPLHFSSIFFFLSTSGSWKQEQASSPLVAIKMHLFTVVLNNIAFFLHSSRVVVLMLSGGLQAFLIPISQPSRISVTVFIFLVCQRILSCQTGVSSQEIHNIVLQKLGECNSIFQAGQIHFSCCLSIGLLAFFSPAFSNFFAPILLLAFLFPFLFFCFFFVFCSCVLPFFLSCSCFFLLVCCYFCVSSFPSYLPFLPSPSLVSCSLIVFLLFYFSFLSLFYLSSPLIYFFLEALFFLSLFLPFFLSAFPFFPFPFFPFLPFLFFDLCCTAFPGKASRCCLICSSS